MENADDILFETPINGHIPRKYDKTKLFTMAAEKNINISSIIFPLLF
jgi:hypothetical protein